MSKGGFSFKQPPSLNLRGNETATVNATLRPAGQQSSVIQWLLPKAWSNSPKIVTTLDLSKIEIAAVLRKTTGNAALVGLSSENKMGKTMCEVKITVSREAALQERAAVSTNSPALARSVVDVFHRKHGSSVFGVAITGSTSTSFGLLNFVD